MMVKMIQDLGETMESHIDSLQEMFNKELEDLKNKETKMDSHLKFLKNF